MQKIIDKNINNPLPNTYYDSVCKNIEHYDPECEDCRSGTPCEKHQEKCNCLDENKYTITSTYEYTINKYFICATKPYKFEFDEISGVKYTKLFFKFELAEDDGCITIHDEPYEFIGVVIHKGDAFYDKNGKMHSSGHYVAFIKYDKWYLYDDSSRTESSYEKLMNYIRDKKNNASPYMMLYRKVNADYFTEEKIPEEIENYLV